VKNKYMATTVDNIIQGAARIFMAPKGEPMPSGVGNTASYSTIAGNWTDVGFTSEGLELTVEPDYLDVEVDQLLDSAALFKTSQRVTLTTSFTESTLTNLAFVIGQASGTVADVSGAPTANTAGAVKALTVSGGSLGSAPLERALFAVGPGPRANTTSSMFSERLYYVPRVISAETVTTGVKRNEASVFPVTFRCLPDSTQVNQEYGQVVDRLYGT
jgi:hypothetical protein